MVIIMQSCLEQSPHKRSRFDQSHLEQSRLERSRFEQSRLERSRYDRTRLIIGDSGINTLESAHVLVFGLGGVGGFVCEALVRAGIGSIGIVDFDVVDITNINRQIIALDSTIGQLKTECVKSRLLDINPKLKVFTYDIMYDGSQTFVFENKPDYVVDAIDKVTHKLEIIKNSCLIDVPVISCMGTGNKLHPEKFKITEIEKTHTCPLARIMRNKLKNGENKNLKVLFSEEKPIQAKQDDESMSRTPGSISFVPSIAGLMIAGEVIRHILEVD